jgi:dTDP-4-amino-4,6-dideoxygalactose transaminase
VSAPIPVFAFATDPALDRALSDAAARVMSSRRYVLGAEVEAFEREFAAFCGTRACIGVANGTDALELALRASGVAAGSRVATVANAGYYTCTALAAIGAEPVFIDVDESLTMSSQSLDGAIDGLDAVVVTHLYGRLGAIEAIIAIAGRRGIPVIEDCAQAHGAERAGKRAGSFGAAGCFSFYPTKNLGALGDGGAVITPSDEIAASMRALRQYGWSTQYHVDRHGGRNSRLDALQAAFLRVKLSRLTGWNDERRAIARRYREALPGLGWAGRTFDDGDDVAHLVVVRSREREALRAALASEGIATGVHYPIADHRQLVRRASSAPSLPVTEAACREVVTLPCYPGLAGDDVDRVIRTVRANLR